MDHRQQVVDLLRDKASRPVRFTQAKLRRDMMRKLEICINSSFVMPPKPGSEPRKPSSRPRIKHGKVVKAGKCQRCCDVHDGKPVSS